MRACNETNNKRLRFGPRDALSFVFMCALCVRTTWHDGMMAHDKQTCVAKRLKHAAIADTHTYTAICLLKLYTAFVCKQICAFHTNKHTYMHNIRQHQKYGKYFANELRVSVVFRMQCAAQHLNSALVFRKSNMLCACVYVEGAMARAFAY